MRPILVRNTHGKGSHVEQRVQEIHYGQNRHLQNEPYGALLCKIGESGEVMVAGTALTFTSEVEGMLYMDSNVAPGKLVRGECSGEIAVTVEVVKKQP